MTLFRRPRHEPATGWFITSRFATILWTCRGIEDYLAVSRRWGCPGSLDPDGWMVRRNTPISQNWYLDKGRKQRNSGHYQLVLSEARKP